MFLPDLVVRSRRTVLATAVRPAAIHIRHGKIIGVMDFDDVPEGCPIDDAADAVVMPGVVDTHVHVGEPDRTEQDEGFDAVTRAAAAGGVTTIVDSGDGGRGALTRSARRPRGNVSSTSASGAASSQGTSPTPAPSRRTASSVSHVTSQPTFAPRSRSSQSWVFRCWFTPCCRDRTSGPLKRRAPTAVGFRGWWERPPASESTPAYLAARPKEAENEAIAVAIDLCRTFRVRTHILHLSSSDALTPLYHARASRLPISVETCPHYLTFVADEIPDGATAFRCEPPIRERENREYLWASLAGGLIQMVVSNHPRCVSAQSQPRGDVDGGERARLFAEPDRRVDVPRAGAACGSRTEGRD